MIVEWLVDFCLAVVEQVILLIPAPDIELGDMAGVFSTIGALNAVIPLDTMLASAAVLFAVTGFMFLFQVFRTLISHLPFIGGKGA